MADLPDYYTQTQISEAEAASFKHGADAAKAVDPDAGDIYLGTDTKKLYICVTDDVWTGFDASILVQGILTLYADMAGGGYEIKNIKDPTAAQSAATRAYMLAQVASYLALAGGTMSGAIAMGTNKITGMGDPTLAQDAATRAYVLAQILDWLLKTGGTMSGAIAMGANKITGLAAGTATGDAARYDELTTHADLTTAHGAVSAATASKMVVRDAAARAKFAAGAAAGDALIYDQLIGLYLLLTGGTMAGAIAMGTNKITGMGDPGAAQDAATQAYVLAQKALCLLLAGGTMAGNIAMATNLVTGLGTPASAGDALRKGTRVTTAELPALTDEKIWKGTGGDPEEVDFSTATKEIYIPALPIAGKEAKVARQGVDVTDTGDGCIMRMLVPQDFVAITAIEVIFQPYGLSGASMHFDIETRYGKYNGGEAYNVHTETADARDIGATITNRYLNHSISDLVDVAALAAGDLLIVSVTYDAAAVESNAYVSGLRLKYS